MWRFGLLRNVQKITTMHANLGKLQIDARKSGRINGKDRMVRRCFQTGCLFKKGKRRKTWVARWREPVVQLDGTTKRVLRAEILGLVGELSEREARNKMAVLLRPINEGRYRPEATITFNQFLQQCWEPAVVPQLKPSSVRYYGLQIRCHLLPTFGTWRIKDITKAEVQRFLAGKRKQGLSGSTVHGIRTALGKVLQAAVDWDYLEQNSARGIRLGDRAPIKERMYLLPNQLSPLLNSLPEPCRTLVVVAVLTGLRIGELLALRWKHVDFIHDVIHVRETVHEGQFGTPKTKSSRRDVPMSEPARKALAAQRRGEAEAHAEDLVFAGRNGSPINPKNLLRRVVQPTCRKLNLPVISWHSFRHTHATLLGEVGESLRTAQAILGHSDLKTTLNIYTHAIPESQKRAVEKVAGLVFPTVPEFSADTENGKAN
jgi:integrase